MQITIFDTRTLLGVYEQVEAPSNYWLDLCFPTSLNFTDEYIDFEKITNKRRLAPFVAPTAQGRPIYSEGSTVTRLRPAYVKPKDVINPHRMMKRRPGQLLSTDNQTPQARYNAVIADVLRVHRDAIERRNEWLAARAIIDGRVTIVDQDYPERVVDFKRDANLTVTLGVGTYWTTTSDIIGDLEIWRDRVRRAKFGGPTNRLTVGADVWAVMRKNEGLMKQLDRQVRGTNADFTTGLRAGEMVEYVGNLGGGLDVYVYSDYYENEDGTTTPFMSSKDVVLTGPNVNGVRCFAAILDARAGLQALTVFSKMWEQEDPSATILMTQSAPLMVPVNPNNTFKARVLA